MPPRDDPKHYTPVRAARGLRVHAVAWSISPGRTLCGRLFEDGWRVALERLNCGLCKRAIAREDLEK